MASTERVRNLSMGQYLLRRYDQTPRALSFDASSEEELESWKQRFSARLRECLGPFPEPCELDAEVIEVVDEGSYWREKVLFNSEPDMAVVSYVLVPKDIAPGERRPAILACHGHGNGKDDVCGIDHGERRRASTTAELNYPYARELALRGYVVMAPDWRGFGERSFGGDSPGKDSCGKLFIKGMLLGVNLLTLNIWDAKCAITYLQSRPDVDPERLGCVGLSYGGTITLFTTALEERIRCAVVSGYLNAFGVYALGMANFCGAQTPVGLLKYGEMWDVGCLISPRPLLVESCMRDEGFPIEASRKSAQALRRCYQVAGAPDRFDVDEFDAGHQWSGRKSYDWLDRWLRDEPGR